MIRIFSLAALLVATLAFAAPALADDTNEWHTHEHQRFFWVDGDPGHYEHVYSSIPEVDPHDYYLAFEDLDRNHNGYITRSEVRRYTGCNCTEKTRANLLREFNATDPNHDGRLHKDELGDWLVLDTN